jgi:GNAT superfamily N-acetyltransferase
MSEIVHDVSPSTLLAASENHYVAYGLHCARTPAGEARETPELVWGLSGVPNRYLNGVLRTRLAPDVDVDALIETTLGRFKARRQPMAWWVMPSTQPAELGGRLEAHGLAHTGDAPAMAVDLQALPAQVPAPPGLVLEEVLDVPTLHAWVQTMGTTNEWPEARRDAFVRMRQSQGLGARLPYRTFLARLDGLPVGTSELFLGAGVAAIVWVATLPQARRQGIGATLTLLPLLQARHLGYRMGTLMASEEGYPVYRRLGFQETCWFARYSWMPAEQ